MEIGCKVPDSEPLEEPDSPIVLLIDTAKDVGALMATLVKILSCLGIAGFVPVVWAQVGDADKTRVHVAAGDLADGVEDLGRQVGVNVIYPGHLLDRQTTQGVVGTMSTKQAFVRLLEGTSLEIVEEQGALRIAMAPPPNPDVVPAEAPDVASPLIANWVEHDVRVPCGRCEASARVHEILAQLGAAGITVTRRSATFLSLAPGGSGDVASGLATAARWRTVRFDAAELSSGLLPLFGQFTTRNPRESEGQIAVDVLVADSPLDAPECHRVSQQSQQRRLCGSTAQWRDLRVRTGFRCSNRESDVGAFAGSRYALCASDAEWQRLTRSRQSVRSAPIGDPFWLSQLGGSLPGAYESPALAAQGPPPSPSEPAPPPAP